MEKLNLIRLADIKEYLPMFERGEITKSRFADLLNISANNALIIHNVSKSLPDEKPDWCTEDKHIPGCHCDNVCNGRVYE